MLHVMRTEGASRGPTRTAMAVLVALFPLILGCGSSLPGAAAAPFAPSPAQPIAPSPAAPWYADGNRWNLQATYQGHTGPEACVPAFDGTPGKPIAYVLGVQRYAATIHLVTEHNHYLGTIVDNQFVANDNYDDGATWQCGAA